jgi:hypothetical protein
MPIDKAANFPDVAHVQNGEPATEDTFARPTIDLENRTDELKAYADRLDLKVSENLNADIDLEGVVGFQDGKLAWVQDIKIFLPNRSYELSVGSHETGSLTAGDVVYVDLPYEVSGSAGIPDEGLYDGQIVYLKDTGLFKEWSQSGSAWGAWTLQDLTPKVSSGLPSGVLHLDSLVLAYVYDTSVYFRNRCVTLAYNESKELDAAGGSGGARSTTITFNGSQTQKDVDLSTYLINSERSGFMLLDNANDHEDITSTVKWTRPDSDTIRITTANPLASGNYTLVVMPGVPL